jgi:hypothetical protein
VTKRVWQFDPSRGGRPVPDAVRRAAKAAILAHGQRHFTGRYRELDVRFKAQFCYVDAYVEPEKRVADEESVDAGGNRGEYLERVRSSELKLCRLRFFAPDRWSLAIYSYAQERYEASVFADGGFVGRPQDGFDLAADLYLG